jgi:tetratricopeptide (TPR) repeat protein
VSATPRPSTPERGQKVDSFVKLWIPAALALVACAFAAGGGQPVFAAPKPAPSASPSPAPSPMVTREPLDQQIPRLQALLQKNPNDRESLGLLAQDFFETGRPDLTVALTQKLIQGGQKTAQIYYLEGISLNQLGKPKEALADLEQASNLEPTNLAVLSTLANMYLQANRGPDAEKVALRAIKFNQTDKQAYITYGQVLAAEQKYDEARQQFEAAVKLDDKDAEPFIYEAQTYEKQSALALASQEYDRAIAADPKSQPALLGKARILSNDHDVKNAVAIYTQVLGLVTTDTDHVAIMDEIAHLYAVEKMNAEADNEYRLAIQQYPKEAAAHLAYGDYLAFTKDTAGAEREWLAAAGPNNNFADAEARLGDYYGQKKDLDRAITHFKRLSELSANDPRVWLTLGNAYAANKQYDKAAAAYKQSYAIQRGAEALLGLAQADFLGHNYKECSVIYEALDKNQPQFAKVNPNVLYVLGQCYENSNQLEKALATYKRFLPFTRPGSQAQKQTNQIIAEVQAKLKPAKKPQSSATTGPAKAAASH